MLDALLLAVALTASPRLTVSSVPPPPQERVNMIFLTTSMAGCGMALGATMACTADGSCREVNPVMRRLIGRQRATAIVVKAATCGGTHYLAWRNLRGWVRTAVLGGLMAFNVWDGLRDVMILRRIDAKRGR